MASLDSLKRTLKAKASPDTSDLKQPLSTVDYRAGFELLLRTSDWKTYENFITAQISRLVNNLIESRNQISVLEIGPGPKSIIGHLSSHIRYRIRKYTAFEPDSLFATDLPKTLDSESETESLLPNLETAPTIYQKSIEVDDVSDTLGKFDVILFSHSMYDMNPKRHFVAKALEMLVDRPTGGMVILFHQEESLEIEGLLSCRTVLFPTAVIRIPDDDQTLDYFSRFIAGFTIQDSPIKQNLQAEWRQVCRSLGRREQTHPDLLTFHSPKVMMAFTHSATALPELTAHVLLSQREVWMLKNSQARSHHSASIVRPTTIQQVQKCVLWALEHRLPLTVLAGGHSDTCLAPNTVAVDMSAFKGLHIVPQPNASHSTPSSLSANSVPTALIVAETGCTTGEIIRAGRAAGVTVPLGSRPSVGAGLWLQGGLGHLSRMYGLASDAVVGAVLVGVASGQLLCVGRAPEEHRPVDAVWPENGDDLLWALKGAGTNFGIVVSVAFEARAAMGFRVTRWVVPVEDSIGVQAKIREVVDLAKVLENNCSMDLYLFGEDNRLRLVAILYEASTTWLDAENSKAATRRVTAKLGPQDDVSLVDGIGLFDTELCVSGIHGEHGGGKTSAFKRCLFFRDMGSAIVAHAVVTALQTRPSSRCYINLIQGGGAIAGKAADATAFACREWDFACVIAGIWAREQDGTDTAREVIEWVYTVIQTLLPFGCGVYGADLGPDPRDTTLVLRAFRPNLPRLARLKRIFDPHNTFVYACALKTPPPRKLIVLVTGETCVGKDHCAAVWTSFFATRTLFTAHAISISEATKREYAATTGADFDRLLRDRAYKERHRPTLTKFFEDQVKKRPHLPEEHFLNVVHDAPNADVLFVTGLRDDAPVASLSHLVPEHNIFELRVRASSKTRRTRGGDPDGDDNVETDRNGPNDDHDKSNLTAQDYCPDLIFENDTDGNETAEDFANRWLLPLCHDDLRKLAELVRLVPNFPRQDIEFRHVLDIVQQPGGLDLCASLLQRHFAGDWADVGAIACCEAGGFIYGSALAARVGVALALIREAGKLPPPTVSVVKDPSHVSSLVSHDLAVKRIEMDPNLVSRGGSVVVVDDVLATGRTLCAVLRLLVRAGIRAETVSVLVVAEFPLHRGRDLLRRAGFGRVKVQSLLVFGGA